MRTRRPVHELGRDLRPLNIHSLPPGAPLEPRYNIAPTTQVQVVLPLEDNARVAPVRWGWRPHWAQDRAEPINACAEKVAHGPFFRPIRPNRMLCPVSGWFEWVDEGGQKKQPYFIRRWDGTPTLCASIGQLHDEPRDDNGFVIITVGVRLRSPLPSPGNGWTRRRRRSVPRRCWPQHKVRGLMRIDGAPTSLGVLIARILARNEGFSSPYLILSERGRHVSPSMLRDRWEAAGEEAQKAALEAGDPGLGELIREFQFKDIRPKAATEINDLKEASRLLEHTEEEITKTVYVRRGAIAKPSK